MRATNSNSTAINPTKSHLVIGIGLSALVALVASVYMANSNAASAVPVTKQLQRPAASIQLADPTIEEAEAAMYPERSFKKLKCKTATECEKATAKRIEQLDKQIPKMQARINKHGANIVKLNDKIQILIAERKHLATSSVVAE